MHVISHNRTNSASPNSKRKRQTDNLKAQINKLRRRSFVEPGSHSSRIPTTILESRYREMINSVNRFMDFAIEKMPLNIKSHWLHPQDIHPFLLCFTSGLIGKKSLDGKNESSIFNTEKMFAQQSDPFFIDNLYPCVDLKDCKSDIMGNNKTVDEIIHLAGCAYSW
ncbi:unnamed protein product, partial [Medioppia subpectinata]